MKILINSEHDIYSIKLIINKHRKSRTKRRESFRFSDSPPTDDNFTQLFDSMIILRLSESLKLRKSLNMKYNKRKSWRI